MTPVQSSGRKGARRLAVALILAGFIYISSPLLIPVAMGAVFGVLFFPLLEWLEKRKVGTRLGAALVTVGVTLLILIPATTLIFLGAKTGFEQLRRYRETPAAAADVGFFESLVSAPVVQGAVERLSTVFPISVPDLLEGAENLARTVSLRLADLLGGLFSHLPGKIAGLAIMVVSIYFFLVDGRALVLFIRRNSVFDERDTEQLIASFAGMCRSVVLATVLSGVFQSLLFLLACVVAGVPSALLLGFIVFLASFIPLVGAAPVTFGTVIYELVVGNKVGAIFLLVVAVLVTLVDNVVRPWVLKGSGNLHPLMAFVAAFGGLQVLGFSGVFLGPILAALFLSTLQSLTREEREELA